MNSKELIKSEDIQNRIFEVRGLQVMLDKDLAAFYGVKPIRLREQVKRNIKRFPADFMFQLTENEVNFMVSQNAIPSKQYLGGYLPFAFTEQGVAGISSVLTSERAIEVNIQIMRAFVNMRRFIATTEQVFNRLENVQVHHHLNNERVLHRLDAVERKQIEYKAETDHKFEEIFNAIEERSITPKQGIFFDGQIFDAYQFVSNVIRSANKSLLLIDNYVDDTVLTLFEKRKKKVKIKILTKNVSKQLKLDVEKFNQQYPEIEIIEFNNSHDRFLIIDNKAVYHFGASLKDLGKKWFAFSKMDIGVGEMLNRIEDMV